MAEPTTIDRDEWAARVDAARKAAADAHGELPPARQPYNPNEVHEDEEAMFQRSWSAIPARFTDAIVHDLDGPLQDLHKRWCKGNYTQNVLLLGNVGSGKTHAAVALLRTAAWASLSIRFAPVVELLDELRPGSPGSGDIERAIRPDVLVLDDLGGEKPTDWTAERLYAVVNRRWLEQRPTIATSNLGQDALEEAVGSRTWSRLYHGALRLKLAGDDRRKAA